jgi:16S rRNA (cytosine967-C5)-methyltransferase
VSSRKVAIDALVRVEDGAFAHIAVPELLRRTDLDQRDRAFVTELVYGTVRMRRTLDFLLAPLSSRPLDALDPPVRAALRVGAYQLGAGMRPHAAVGETVEAAPGRARGFVNGILRALARAGPPWDLPAGDDVAAMGVRTSHPDWIVRTLVDAFGIGDARATLALDDEAPPVTLRVNPMRTTPDAAARELMDAGIEVERGALVPDALVIRGSGDLAALPAIVEGRVTPQDQTSQAIVAIIDAQPGERVADLAAAPGGKATAMAERMHGDGLVVAADVHIGRVHTVARAATRVGLEGPIAAIVADGRRPPLRADVFDRVLLDAPCSGLGVLRRRPDARWRVQPDDVTTLGDLQRDLLAAAATLARPGGRLVYAVCTLTDEETLAVDEFAAAKLPEFVAQPPPGTPWRAHGRGAILLPSDAGTDGMFVLGLQRAG